MILIKIIFFLLSWGSLCSCLDIPDEVNVPPLITKQPKDIVYAVEGLPLNLPCEARGRPAIKNPAGYSWQKDGSPLDVVDETNAVDGAIVMARTSGTIQFRGSESLTEDELKNLAGKYQCFASNELGTAMTNIVTIKVAMDHAQRPEDKLLKAREGDFLSIPCVDEVSNEREIEWKFESGFVSLSERVSQRSDGGIVFSNVIAESDDDLVFYCIVKNLITRKSADGPHYTLRVDRSNPIKEKRTAIVDPEDEADDKVFLHGNDITLTCAATGKPTPTVWWEKISGRFPEARTTIKDFGKTVVIRDATDADEGAYKCTANNTLNVDIKVVKVAIHSKPYFLNDTYKPHDIIKAPGDNVTIRCEPQGEPKPVTEWRVNGQPFSAEPSTPNRVVESEQITIFNVKQEDTAVYQCISNNTYGTVIEQGYVNVLTSEPIFISSDEGLMHKQVEGNDINIKCHYFGSPQPTIMWMKNGTDVTSDDRFALVNGENLDIMNLQKSDSGVYSCAGENNYGRNSTDFNLKVLNKTKLIPMGGNTQSVVVGSLIELRVKVVMDEETPGDRLVTWRKNGVTLGSGDSFLITDAGFEDAGSYHAVVRTDLDQDDVYVRLTVIDYPSPPEEFNFEKTDNPWEVKFTWQLGSNGNAPITDYKIEFEEDHYEPGKWQVLRDSIRGSGRAITLPLSPNVNYQFRAKAKNEVGWSKSASKTTERYLTPPGPPLNPTGVNGTGTTPGNVLINWNPVRGLDQNGPGFGYRLSYMLPNESNVWRSAEIPGSVTFYEIVGSDPYIPIQVKVESYNNNGTAKGKETTISVFTGEDVPLTSPTNVETESIPEDPTKLLLRWDAVDEGLVRGKILGYVISYRPITSDSKYATLKVPNMNSGTVEDLLPETSYDFGIQVFNSAGSGNMSTTTTASTPRGAPWKGTVVVNTMPRSANVTWLPSKSGFPAQNAYVEYKKQEGNNPWMKTEAYDAVQNGLSMQVQNLQPQTVYVFRVVSVNQYGSAATDPFEATTANAEEISAGGVSNEIWFIVILCMVGLLIIVVLIIFFVKKRKGKKYPVTVSEQEQPINEAQSPGKDYTDETDDVKAPLTETDGVNTHGKVKPRDPQHTRGDSVGGDSIGAFVGDDPNEFNEDGSFIGQYGVIHSPNGKTSPTSPSNGTTDKPTGDAV